MGQDAIRSVNSPNSAETLFSSSGIQRPLNETLFQTDRMFCRLGSDKRPIRQILYIASMGSSRLPKSILKTDNMGQLNLSDLAVIRILDTIGAIRARRSKTSRR